MSSRLKTAALAISIAGAGVLLTAVTSGIVFERAQRARDRERFPPVGRLVDIGDRSLNLYCSGMGQPTVIFESGAIWLLFGTPKDVWQKGSPRPGLSWVAVQREIAKLTTACWYDRAGSGWSDLGPYPRDSESQARDLHAMLHAAGVRPPYVLVPESSAAMDARVYTKLYPEEVAGLTFVNGIHPDFFRRTRPGGAKRSVAFALASRPQDFAAHAFNDLGFNRLAPQRPAPPVPPGSELSEAEWKTIWHLTQGSTARSALLQDIAAFPQSTAEARSAGSLGDRPTTVLSSGMAALPPAYRAIWMDEQADLARLSSRGKKVVVEGATGDILYEAPQAIVAAVRDVLEQGKLSHALPVTMK